jgi:hypothetical protein
MRHKPYRNKRIISVIRYLYFTGGVSSFAERFNSKFPQVLGADGALACEIPQAMLALVATAVSAKYQHRCHTTNTRSQLYAALHEWRAGTHSPTEFSTDAFLDVYDGHVGTLENLRKTRPGAYHVMMADIYNLWYVCPLHCLDHCL